MIDQQWLTILIVILIVVILVDGVRRMRKAKKDSIKMSLKKHFDDDDIEDDVIYGSEFPNGGARASESQIDKDRILKARSKYNFGDDLPVWNQSDSTKENTVNTEAPLEEGSSRSAEPSGLKIEPSISDVDQSLDASLVETSPLDDGLAIEEIDKTPEPAQAADPSPSDEPIQTSLNLDDDVPMLMEKVDSTVDVKEASEKQKQAEQSGFESIDEVKPRAKPLEKPIQSIASKIKAPVADIDTRSANKPRYESKYTTHADKKGQIPTDVIVINLRTRGGEMSGSDLLPVLLENGLRYGAMDIFHYHAEEDGEGDVLFSMANIVKPGTFDLATFESFQTVGLSFFLTLPVSNGGHIRAFDTMIEVTQSMATALEAELLDENRSFLTRQTIEHYRERVRDFSRREQLEKNKQP